MPKFEGGSGNTENAEAAAERELDRILDDPEYEFLNAIPQNQEAIENAPTAVEALRIARVKIAAREERTFRFRDAGDIEGVTEVEVSYEGVRRTFTELNARRQEIGSGGDAVVYVATREAIDGVYEVCYKLARLQGLHKGRNTVEQELDIHVEFYQAAKNLGLRIGVPEPFYFSEMGSQKLIAMERLQARSIDDLRRGRGSIPAWVDEAVIDEFCDQLRQTIDGLHKAGLYHRDLHFGNIMLTQSPTESPYLGYIIDFGVSTHGHEGLDPYRSESRGEVFTYDDDYGRIEAARTELKRLCGANA